MQKTKRPLSFLLAVLMIVGMFAAVPFTASAKEFSEFLDLGRADVAVSGEHFKVTPTNMRNSTIGWSMNDETSKITISALNGETISKLKISTTERNTDPVVTANGTSLSYTWEVNPAYGNSKIGAYM